MEQASAQQSAYSPGNRGFTLVELIMALTVLAAALGGLVAMYGFSLEFANESRQKAIALEIAEAQLAMITAAPGAFIWRFDQEGEKGLFPVTVGDDDPQAGNTAELPEVRLVDRKIQTNTETLYRRFRWQAWGRLPSPDAQAYELTVVVRWRARGRQRSLALTSALAKNIVDGTAIPQQEASP